MAGVAQPVLDALCSKSDDMAPPPSPQDSCLRRRRRGIPATAMSDEIAALEDTAFELFESPGLSQRELDEVGTDGGDCASPKLRPSSLFTEHKDVECPPSPQDSFLRKRRRRISVSAMSAEIAALADAAHEQSKAPGVAQRELDNVAVDGQDAEHCSSPVSSGLLRIKRSRLSVGQGRAGAAARAAELLRETSPATAPTGSMGSGLSQQQLDSICSGYPERNTTCNDEAEATHHRSPGSKRRARRVSHEDENQNCIKHDENASPVRISSKDLSYGSPGSPPSPCRGRAGLAPLSPVKLN
eukprot:TRINITY_DN43062_c0_g1_i1.p1 TRINITY_DN43062_c0_g1~~TRINITY_DN43062_c0_g1_i1.p1  ORF type:complete len:299 (-),score=55.77 TRINITY_DN43062_c0_g1_i1:318-1214(-)